MKEGSLNILLNKSILIATVLRLRTCCLSQKLYVKKGEKSFVKTICILADEKTTGKLRLLFSQNTDYKI